MSDSKKFFELVTTDKAVQAELDKASMKALKDLLDAKGLHDESQKALEGAAAKVAEAHGLNLGWMDELDLDEMEAVVGGWDCVGAVSHLVCEIRTW